MRYEEEGSARRAMELLALALLLMVLVAVMGACRSSVTGSKEIHCLQCRGSDTLTFTLPISDQTIVDYQVCFDPAHPQELCWYDCPDSALSDPATRCGR